jgi:hypothetical protein
MKMILVLALSIATTTVMAAAKVGDSATFKANSAGYEFGLKMELTAFDLVKNTFTQKTTTIVGAQSVDEVEEVAADEVAGVEELEMLLALCESPAVNGKLETVAVAAGTFETCAIADAATGTITNVGVVPFGVVKMYSPELTLELTEFKAGI